MILIISFTLNIYQAVLNKRYCYEIGEKNYNKIEEIIGLNAEQFSKIALIAQGEFQELIMDKTGKRK